MSNYKPRPSRRTATLPCMLATLAAGFALLMIPISGSANNDPHRTPVPAGPIDLPAGYCSYPVHLDFPVNKEYQTVTTAPDGSTVSIVTGSLKVGATNQLTGKTMTFNASGPGSLTISANGQTGVFDSRGLFFLFAPNATQFGFPSNVVVTSGPWSFVSDLATNNIVQLTTAQPHVLSDVCAAIH